MTRLAVFDWNGTLFNDTPATHAATNACLAFFGIPPITLEQEQENFVFPLIHFYEKMGVDADAYLRHTDETSRIFFDVYERENKKHGLAEGAIDLLEWLESRGVACMILSNHLEELLLADVRRLGVERYMRHISGSAGIPTVARGLSKQIRLEAYMEEHGYAPQDAFIIGDSHEEPELARRLGILGISLSGGLMSPARLEKAGSDHLIHALKDLRPILEKHWNL